MTKESFFNKQCRQDTEQFQTDSKRGFYHRAPQTALYEKGLTEFGQTLIAFMLLKSNLIKQYLILWKIDQLSHAWQTPIYVLSRQLTTPYQAL